MLIRTSGEIISDLFLLTLGESAHYYLDLPSPILFDCCASFQLPALLRRLDALHLAPPERVFITHPHAERLAGLALMRKINPRISVYATRETADFLSLESSAKEILLEDELLTARFGGEEKANPSLSELAKALKVDHYIRPGDTVTLTNQSRLRVQSAPGHTAYSVAYLYEPAQHLIADHGFGYFRDQLLCAPGADYSLATTIETVGRFLNFNIKALCLPLRGVISGNLVKRHLSNLLRNVEDLQAEYIEAVKAGVSLDEIQQSIIESFYNVPNKDAYIEHIYRNSFKSLWDQLIILDK